MNARVGWLMVLAVVCTGLLSGRAGAAMRGLPPPEAAALGPGAAPFDGPVAGPAGTDRAARNQDLQPGEWRVDWCATCVGTMAPSADGLWFSSFDSFAHLRTATGEIERFQVPAGLTDRDAWFPFNPVAVAADGMVWGFLSAADGRRTVARFDGVAWHTFSPADGLPEGTPGWRMAMVAGGGVCLPRAAGAARFDGRSWTRYGLAAGLPSAQVTDVAVAPDGRVWLATRGGLAVFDGAAWSTVTAANGLPATGAATIDIGPDGSLWAELWDTRAGVIGHAAGLGRRRDGAWTRFTTADGLPDNQVSGLVFDRQARPWVMTEGGVARFEDDRWRPQTESDGLGGPVDGASALAASADGDLWLGSFDDGAGVARLVDEGWQPYFAADGPRDYEAVGARRAPDGAIWLAYANKGRFRLNRVAGQDWSAVSSDGYVAPPPFAIGALTLVRPAMAFDDAGRLSLSSVHQRQGVARFDGAQWAFTTQPDQIPGTLVYDIAYQSDGTAWYATDVGAVRQDGRGWRLFDRSTGLPGNDVRAVEIAPDGTVWLGTDGGAARLDGDRWTVFRQSSGLAGELVYALGIAPSGTVWLTTYRPAGSMRFALNRYAGGVWSNVATLASVDAMTLAPDGSPWLAAGDRLARFDRSGLTWFIAPADIALTSVNDIAVGDDGTVWLPGTSNGANVVVRFRSPPSAPTAPTVYLPRTTSDAGR
jgi:hypothetical protein